MYAKNQGASMRRRIAILTVLFAALLVHTAPAQEASTVTVPNLVRYAGTLKDGNGVALSSTTVGVTFAVYRQQDGGAAVWMETQSVTTDAAGNYNVLLGSTTSTGLSGDLFSQPEQRWLGVQVEGQPEQARVQLVSVPYALKAHEAETLGGRSVSDFVLSKQAGSVTANSATTNPAPTTGGIVSINGDGTPTQTLIGGLGVTVTDTGNGGHTIATSGYGLQPITVVHANGGVTLYTPST